jgi:hypothetical protein
MYASKVNSNTVGKNSEDALLAIFSLAIVAVGGSAVAVTGSPLIPLSSQFRPKYDALQTH